MTGHTTDREQRLAKIRELVDRREAGFSIDAVVFLLAELERVEAGVKNQNRWAHQMIRRAGAAEARAERAEKALRQIANQEAIYEPTGALGECILDGEERTAVYVSELRPYEIAEKALKDIAAVSGEAAGG